MATGGCTEVGCTRQTATGTRELRRNCEEYRNITFYHHIRSIMNGSAPRNRDGPVSQVPAAPSLCGKGFRA